MKKIKWKILIITIIICLLPMVLGGVYYNELPNEIAVHFDINNNPDNYASKAFALFGLPIFMALMQIFCCVISDISNKEDKKYKLVTICKWIIPVTTIVIYVAMLGVALGNDLDIRKIVCLFLGIVFILVGNYVPKTDQNAGFRTGIHLNNLYNKELDEKDWRKLSRVTGYSFIVLGILLIISLLFQPIYTVAVIGLVILASILITIYTFVLSRKGKK